MTIREVMASALRFIGREDIAADVESGVSPGGEGNEVVKTMLYCVNATEAELARYYHPLIHTEILKDDSGYYFYYTFSYTPIKILSVKSGGAEVEYNTYQNHLFAKYPEIEITYMYEPKKQDIDGQSSFALFGDGRVTALGAASEYCLMCGETKMAEVWETRYRSAIERAKKDYRPPLYIPPRRWV